MAEGSYNPFDPLNPANEAAYDLIRGTASREGRGDLRSYSGSLNFDFLDLPGGPVGWAVGAERIEEDFQDKVDPATESLDLIGNVGSSAQGERTITAAFAEAYFPILSSLEASAALRWDKYDDSAGSELSAYFSARYQPADWLLFRASWGEGFRAANMNNLYGAIGFGAIEATDLTGCSIAGIAEEDCFELEYAVFSGGNPDLLPELSDSLNVGFVVDWEPVQIRVDLWNVNIEEGIGITTLSNLLFLERRGLCQSQGQGTTRGGQPAEVIQCLPGNFLYRAPGGTLLEALTGWGNTSKSEHAGVDLFLSYEWETVLAGDFNFSVLGTRVLRDRFRTETSEDWASGLGEAGLRDASPKYRGVGVIRWNYTDHTVAAYIRYTHGYVRPDVDFAAPSHTEFDLLYQWNTPWDGRVTVGVQNLTDEDPELDPNFSQRPTAYSLYGLDGRQPYISYRHYF